MCELLGLSANTPADIRYSFAVLKQRGGNTGNHTDGWGIAAYSGKRAKCFRDAESCMQSNVAQFIETHPIQSTTIISHIRKANRGKVCLENTHPFSRELYGQDWVFAHNGQLKGIKRRQLNTYHPIGTTDSEYAFCFLLDCIREAFPEKPRNPKKIWYLIEEVAKEIMHHGVFSFLLSDGKYLYAFSGKKLFWLTRKHDDLDVHFIDTQQKININTMIEPQDVFTFIASSPITSNENWQVMNKGEFYVFNNGQMMTQVKDRRKIKREQRGYSLSA